jgi:hypothetical protein
MVIQAGVMKSRLRRKRWGVCYRPDLGHVFAQGLGTRVQRRHASGAALAAHLGIEVSGITFRAEGSRTVASVLTPPDPPDSLAARARGLFDAHRVLLVLDALRDPSHSTDRRDGPASRGTLRVRPRGIVRSGLGALTHSSTARAEMIHRDPRLTACSSPRAMAHRIVLGDTSSSSANDSTV